MKNKIAVIAGPTATGKTRLAVMLAKRFNGEVISADSMQIYRHMDIGSAKPTKEETEGVPHHLIDVVNPDEPFSVARYVELANLAAQDILSRGKLPIIAGGTGLYISSFIDNVKFTQSQTDFELREKLLKEAEDIGCEALHKRLSQIDPKSAEGIHPNNVKRVVRALELFETTGLTLSEQNENSKTEPSPYEPIMIALNTEREVLYERINLRVDIMLSCGLLDEIKNLKQMGLAKDMQSMQGIGYKEILSYLDGEISLDEATELVKKNSRNYAKRQLTWFKRDERYKWLDCMAEDLFYQAEETVKQAIG
ncbi:MAG: tRNA (adenosine(37)-N6)-dimethylallyltransferase MiaA [Clostridia bacterium]|nr:tRNA (adenosine(37)-N6)-dimethylallyltransferase MiaA [Clostridia bacterium]